MKKVYVAAKAITLDKGKFLVIKEVIGGKDVWGLPGGKIKHGETPEAALVREIKEEVGLDIAIERLAGIYWFFMEKVKGGHQVICITYICRPRHKKVDLTKNPAPEENISAYRWVTKDEFLTKTYGTNKSREDLIRKEV